MEARFNNKWLWIGIIMICLVSCSEATSNTISENIVTKSISNSPSPTSTQTIIPATSTPLPAVSTDTPTIELPTETPFPTETQTHTVIPWPTSETFFDGARITFIDNAGFLITIGDKKILIDAIFDSYGRDIGPPQELIQRVVNAEPPFDQIDLVFATHIHVDHFSANLVREHLRNNRQAVFVSSPDAIQQIKQAGDEYDERLIQVNLQSGESSRLTVNEIELECFNITYGITPIPNIEVIITVDDYIIFHSGDLSADSLIEDADSLAIFNKYQLSQKELDIALLPSYYFYDDEFVDLIVEGIQARYVSPMHYLYQYPPNDIENNFSNAVVFKDTLTNWVIPKE